ncbi:hypothetical protein H257_15531 [Aphanomyces astaci]|uniref:Uncharacterized protein n=1 Tax=Aphanomyces astaci TaxID=112090 RepID=W4FNZ7_APHAT|nr:hypothetical protein H257_15531 [Aphanomyces astaci]ETV68544.1 hypothetical protein H257_15531 [Aphanomyces astaci]|eukprot:XP_009841973.1 hypothetical protein H257_15531 [Aphanomyces astaci]
MSVKLVYHAAMLASLQNTRTRQCWSPPATEAAMNAVWWRKHLAVLAADNAS